MCHFVAPANVKRATVVNCRPMTSFIPCATLRHRAGAWLSLFAMLLVFAGPLIGQGMSQGRTGRYLRWPAAGYRPGGAAQPATIVPSSRIVGKMRLLLVAVPASGTGRLPYHAVLRWRPTARLPECDVQYAAGRGPGLSRRPLARTAWCPRLTHPANRGRQLTLAQWRQGTSVATPCVAQRLPRGPFT